MVNPSKESRSWRHGLPGERAFEPLGDGAERGLLLGGLPERPDHDGDDAHGADALAAHVPQHEAHAVRGVLDGVQVAADRRPGLRGLVACGDVEAREALGRLRHDGELRGLGDVADGGEAGAGAADEHVGEDGEGGDGGHRQQLGGGVDVRHDPEHGVDRDHGQDGGQGGQGGAARRVQGGGDQGRRGEQGCGGEVGRGEAVVDDRGDEQQHREEGQHGTDAGRPAAAVPDGRGRPLLCALPHGTSVAGQARRGTSGGPGGWRVGLFGRRGWGRQKPRGRKPFGLRPRGRGSGDRI